MISYPFDDNRLGTGSLFPPEIGSRNWVGYHCTSVEYSKSIEQSGFGLTKRISDDSINTVRLVGIRNGIDVSSIDGYLQIQSISFFPLSELCLAYLRREKLGGQGLGVSRPMSFWYGQLSAIVEPIASVLGAAAVITFAPILPYALAFAAGAMIYVVIEELIPESHAHGNEDLATVSALFGFLVMMTLDVALG